MTFISQKDGLHRGIFYLLFMALLYSFVEGMTEKDWLTVAVFASLLLFLLWIWFYTTYTIKNDNLIVKMGPYDKKIAIADIHTVLKTTNLLPSLALSRKRIGIKYGKHQSVTFISPRDIDTDTFIEMLLEINPKIQVKEKKK